MPFHHMEMTYLIKLCTMNRSLNFLILVSEVFQEWIQGGGGVGVGGWSPFS